MITKYGNEQTILSYSDNGARHYEAQLKENLAYGNMTIDFLNRIALSKEDKIILDIGCGTGFAFDVLDHKFGEFDLEGIGIDPAGGMVDIAKQKFAEKKRYTFEIGCFEDIPLQDKSVDKIVSTLALHWATSLQISAHEMRRVLKPNGSVDVLMIASDDGYNFKKPVVRAMEKHMSFPKLMRSAVLAQRVTKDQLKAIFEKEFSGYSVDVQNIKQLIYGSFEEHMMWWKARSSAIIHEIKDIDTFMKDLESAMKEIEIAEGIPFDLSCLVLSIKKN
ncbi:MAG: class I SAM-dependent methyltransferase [Ruminiclostridium sp.]